MRIPSSSALLGLLGCEAEAPVAPPPAAPLAEAAVATAMTVVTGPQEAYQ